MVSRRRRLWIRFARGRALTSESTASRPNQGVIKLLLLFRTHTMLALRQQVEEIQNERDALVKEKQMILAQQDFVNKQLEAARVDRECIGFEPRVGRPPSENVLVSLAGKDEDEQISGESYLRPHDRRWRVLMIYSHPEEPLFTSRGSRKHYRWAERGDCDFAGQGQTAPGRDQISAKGQGRSPGFRPRTEGYRNRTRAAFQVRTVWPDRPLSLF